MLQLQIVSDLHLEFYKDHKFTNIIKPSAQILCLLGDIHPIAAEEDFKIYVSFIIDAASYYKKVIIITGNHEYYDDQTPSKKSSVNVINTKLTNFFKNHPQIHFLNNTGLQLTVNRTKYTIIGTTLWSYIPKAQHKRIQESMNDYTHIYSTANKLITPTYITKLFKQNYEFIQQQIKTAKQTKSKLIVLTHHKPYISNVYNVESLDPAYESDCSELFQQPTPIVLWAYGHTHKKDLRIINKVKFYSNPRGYPHERTQFDRNDAVII